MDCYVISLPDAGERRSRSEQRLNNAGINFCFFDAYKPRNGYEDFFKSYNEREFQINTGRKVTKGEIGCYASHKALWELCVKRNKPIMIMEDDFFLTDDFSDAYKAAADSVNSYGFIRLQNERRGKSKLVKKIDKFDLVYYTKMPHSLMCYAIAPNIAKKLLVFSKVIDAPVDVMIKKIWVHKQRLYGLSPYTVHDSELSADTTISGRVKHKKSLDIQILRLFRKSIWFIRRLIFTSFFKPPIY